MQDIAIKVQNVNKVYKLYDKPIDRLKEALNFSKVKRHREHYALNNISLEVERGETLGIIGTNGSGKSTLLKILTGVLTQTSGQVEINGKISALLELGAGFNMEYTGIENIYLNGSISGYTKDEMDKKLDKIIDFADIGEFIQQPVKTYSSGMFVRLAFAVAINIEPDILIVDEALSVGDNIFQSKCYNKFKEFKEQGKTILMVTHDVDSVRRFCDRCVWIEQGKLRKVGDVNKITSEYMAYTNNTTKIEKKETTNKLQNKEGINKVVIKEKAFDPISRWGSMPSLIKHVGLVNEKNEEIDYLDKNMKFKLVIDVKINSSIIEDNLTGVAFAIKNKKGQDLIVGDTFGEREIFKQEGIYRVSFEMNNYLVPGEYYIVASLEKRETQIPSYIDYIEGAHYFKVGSEKTYYGMIDVPITVKSEII